MGSEQALATRPARPIAGLTVRTRVAAVLCGQALRGRGSGQAMWMCRSSLLGACGIALHRGERNCPGGPGFTGAVASRDQNRTGTTSRNLNFRC